MVEQIFKYLKREFEQDSIRFKIFKKFLIGAFNKGLNGKKLHHCVSFLSGICIYLEIIIFLLSFFQLYLLPTNNTIFVHKQTKNRGLVDVFLKQWKGTSRQISGKGAIRKRFPLQKPRWEKTKLTIRHLYMKHIVSRMSSYFPNRWPPSYLNLIKNMKTYIRRQQHKKFKHQDIKQKEPPQKYRLGTISNTKLLAGINRFYRILTSPSASAVVHNI